MTPFGKRSFSGFERAWKKCDGKLKLKRRTCWEKGKRVIRYVRIKTQARQGREDERNITYNKNFWFQTGFRFFFRMGVFFLVSFSGSGFSLTLTYGSERPVGSIGIRFFASRTEKKRVDSYLNLVYSWHQTLPNRL